MTTRRNFALGIATMAGAAAAGATAAAAQGASRMEASQVVQDWPETAKKAANAMIEKYGQPQEATPTRLIWFDNGPWKRTTVIKEEIDHDFPMPHKDVLEQVVNYQVPPDFFDDLAHYDGSVIVERTRGEISARCDKEAANFLALNLAHDIVQKKKSVQEARQAYGQMMKAMMSGEKPAYTQSLQFEPMTASAAGFSDQPVMEGMAAGASKKK